VEKNTKSRMCVSIISQLLRAQIKTAIANTIEYCLMSFKSLSARHKSNEHREATGTDIWDCERVIIT